MTFHPDDHQAQQLLLHLRAADLDALMPRVTPHLNLPAAQARKLLRPFFHAAQEQHRSLEGFDPDFHTFLLQAASVNIDGSEAKANTVRARLTALSTLYTHLQHQGLLQQHPMQGLQRPAKTLSSVPLLPREAIERLHRHTLEHPALHAALVLIDEHALTIQELLHLTWAHYDPVSRSLARRAGPTLLSTAAEAALHPLYLAAGGLLTDDSALDSNRQIFPWGHEAQLRAELMQACRGVPLPYTSLSDLRRASLRDHQHTVESAGYAREDGQRQLERATRLAQAVVEKIS